MKLRDFLAIAVLVVFALVAASVFGMTIWYSSGTAGISVTQANTTVTFTENVSGGASAAFNARHVHIRSRSTSANSCFWDLRDGTATTADNRIEPGKEVVMEWDPNPADIRTTDGWASMGMICGTGETATFDITASR
jgi:hypothetical protein